MQGEVYLLRGLFNVFSLGMDSMGEQLRAQGVDASVHSGPSWPYLGEQISAYHKQGKAHGPLIISGHSYGADDAIRLARTLRDQGVQVDALVLVDPTLPPKVPANVGLCVNFYLSNPATDWMPWLRGVPVERESQSTEVKNRDLRGLPDHESLIKEVNHFTIEEHPTVQRLVVDQILEVLHRGGVIKQNPISTATSTVEVGRHD